MKKTKIQLIRCTALVLLISTLLFACKKSAPVEQETIALKMDGKLANHTLGHPVGLQTTLRVYGYMLVGDGSFTTEIDNVNLDQLTDVCFSFINPDANGVFTINPDIPAAVTKAHHKSVRAHFAIAGGGAANYWKELIKPANRARVISNIAKVATTNNFDGVDVDIEGDLITSDYNAFVIQLSDTLTKYSKKLSAALSSWKGGLVNQAAYDRFDYLNIMVYDITPPSPGSHSSLQSFKNELNFFRSRVPVGKINLGVPAYCTEYEGGTRTGNNFTYKQILSQFPRCF